MLGLPAYNMYEFLGIADYSSVEEVKKAYFSKLLTVHPDKSHAPENVGEFTKLKQCYDTLRNPASKLLYDNSLRSNILMVIMLS